MKKAAGACLCRPGLTMHPGRPRSSIKIFPCMPFRPPPRASRRVALLYCGAFQQLLAQPAATESPYCHNTDTMWPRLRLFARVRKRLV
jgi:hypothetical protein